MRSLSYYAVWNGARTLATNAEPHTHDINVADSQVKTTFFHNSDLIEEFKECIVKLQQGALVSFTFVGQKNKLLIFHRARGDNYWNGE